MSDTPDPLIAAATLSTYIASEGGDVVIIHRIKMEETYGQQESSYWTNLAGEVSRKFEFRVQPQYDWHVVYIPEIKCFVAISKRYANQEEASHNWRKRFPLPDPAAR